MTSTQTGGPLVTTARYATVADLADVLTRQAAHRLDVVAPATSIRSRDGVIEVAGTDAVIDETGVTTAAGRYRAMPGFDDGITNRLGVPRQWVRWMRDNRPDMYDATVNGLLHGKTRVTGGERQVIFPPRDGAFLLRLFRGDGDGPGIARALLSPNYKPIDNVDVFYTLLQAVSEARDRGVIRGEPHVRADLSENAMDVRVTVPDIAAHAKILTQGYRSPFRDGGARRTHAWQDFSGMPERPQAGDIAWAGLRLRNNEIGQGSLQIAPEIHIVTCGNGQVVVEEAVKAVHLGGKLEVGQIDWSADTRTKAMELAVAKCRDAVATFLDPEFFQGLIARVEQRAAAPVTDPAAAIRFVSSRCGFSEAQQADILRHFALGGQLTSGGVANAVTSAAQELDDPDAAAKLEYAALPAMDAAAAFAANAA